VSRPVRFEPEAVAELEDAALWYDEQRSGLGARFLAAIDATLARIDAARHGASSRGRSGEARSASGGGASVPLSTRHLIQDETIRVLAVAHVCRAPGYWHARAGTPET
jgi:plasmid stabilization system protein ParE